MRTLLAGVVWLAVAGVGFVQDDPPIKTAENDPYKKLNPENQLADIHRQAVDARARLKQWKADLIIKRMDMSAGKDETIKGNILVKNIKGTWKLLWTEKETDLAATIEGKKIILAWSQLKQWQRVDVGKLEDFLPIQLFYPCYDPTALSAYFDIKLMSAASEWQKKLDLTKKDKAPEQKEFEDRLKKFEDQAKKEAAGAPGVVDTTVYHAIELHPKDKLKELFPLIRVFVHMDTFLIGQVEIVESADMMKKTEVRLSGTTVQGDIDDKSFKLDLEGYTVKPKPKKK